MEAKFYVSSKFGQIIVFTFPMWTIGEESICEAVWYIQAVGDVLLLVYNFSTFFNVS